MRDETDTCHRLQEIAQKHFLILNARFDNYARAAQDCAESQTTESLNVYEVAREALSAAGKEFEAEFIAAGGTAPDGKARLATLDAVREARLRQNPIIPSI